MNEPTALRESWERSFEFGLDRFQIEAIDALDAGKSVLVAAPTGSGKTVVAEYAVASALDRGLKVFYTTPIKALSNQKFTDLRSRYGTDKVGLLTGDNSINGDAPVVVMTTEVLRNMIYANSSTLRGLGYVVLDEVHYLQDNYRGPVWEEVIIHAAPDVQLVCLSATVSNATELADWLSTVRGPTACVVEHERPVELVHLYMVGEKGAPRDHLLPTLVNGRPNPEASHFDLAEQRVARRGARVPRRYVTPRRIEVVERLDDEDLLPALYFIFSRAACTEAAANCVEAGLRLTTADERTRIRMIIEHHTAELTDSDLDVLGFESWRNCLEAGIAAHHAGMVPPFKEAVEACFIEGLVKVVFATETLALGVNMPARTVVIEKLSKFTGDHHQVLSASEFTQLTGRAGRRGIDSIGHAVVLWNPFVTFDNVAALASSRTFPLSSAFRPTYNMAVNLVRRISRDAAHKVLQRSFAQFQADRDLVKTETRLAARQQQRDALIAESTCEHGSTEEYRLLEHTVEEVRRRARRLATGDTEIALQRLRPGDVVAFAGAPGGRLLVLATADRRGDRAIKVRGLTVAMASITLAADELVEPPTVVGHVTLPQPYAPNDRTFLREASRRLRTARVDHAGHQRHADDTEAAEATAAISARDSHPVHQCRDRVAHIRAMRQIERVERDIREYERQLSTSASSLTRKFDRIVGLLERRGYVNGWSLTDSGRRLGMIFHESDLLVAESINSGLFDQLDAPSVAALASVFIYEPRASTAPPTPSFPTDELRRRFDRMLALSQPLGVDEAAAGLPLTRSVDPGFMEMAYEWAVGHRLDEVLDDQDVTGGDFVRTTKILIDLLRQIGQAAPAPGTSRTSREAAEALLRGVIEASSRVGDTEPAAAPVAGMV